MLGRIYIEEPVRDGALLVVKHGSRLPKRCAICNEPASGDSIKMTFDDRRNTSLVGSVVAEVFNAIRGSNYTGPVTAWFYLCKKHRAIKSYVWYGILVALVGAGIGALIINTQLVGVKRELWLLLMGGLAIGAVSVAFCLLIGVFNVWNFKASIFNDRYVWLKGSEEPFLNTLQDYGMITSKIEDQIASTDENARK
jgi:hypothetical protein